MKPTVTIVRRKKQLILSTDTSLEVEQLTHNQVRIVVSSVATSEKDLEPIIEILDEETDE